MTAKTEPTAEPELAQTAIDPAVDAMWAVGNLLLVDELPRLVTDAANDLVNALVVALGKVDERRPTELDPNQPALWQDGEVVKP